MTTTSRRPAGPIDTALRPDGRIVVSMTLAHTPVATQAFGVTRLQANGRIDRTFGRRGLARVNFTDFLNTPYAVTLTANGRIVVAGNAESAMM